MNEIKFRVWDIKNQKMMRVDRIDFGIMNKDNCIRVFGYNNHEECYWLVPENYSEFSESEGFILLPYTGRKDINGKKIYKYDIIGTGLTFINGLVDWSDDLAAWIVTIYREKKEKKEIGIRLLCEYLLGTLTGVIGNKFENPELINRDA